MRALVVAVVILLPCAVAAQESGIEVAVRRYDANARYSFEAERYNDALISLLAAQQLLPAVPRLYSIATCYDRLGHINNAIAYYERFVVEVRSRQFRSGGRDQVAATRSILLRRHLTREAARHASEEGSLDQPEPPVIIPESTQPLQLTMPTPPPSRTSTTLRYSFITLASSAGVFAVLSGAFTGISYTFARQPGGDLTVRAQNLMACSYAGWGLAGAAAITATILYLFYRFRSDATSIWLTQTHDHFSQTVLTGGRA